MGAAKRKTGRPPKDRSYRLDYRATRALGKEIDAAATAAGVTSTEWLSRAAAYCVAVRVPLTHLTVC